MPSEDELEVLRLAGHEISDRIGRLKAPRGYASLDTVPPQCSQLKGVSIFQGAPDFNALGLSSQHHAQVASGLNDFATSVCQGMAACWDPAFDLSGYAQHPVTSSTYGVARFAKYAASNEQRTSKAHTDYEMLAIVMSDRPGLEFLSPNGKWVEADWNSSEAVIIAGDMFEVVSRGRIKAAIHRVSSLASDRHSVVFFKGPGFFHPVSPLGGEETMPRDFREHILSMWIRNSPHLQDRVDHLAEEFGIRIPEINPFKRIRPAAA